jgi:chromosome segregation ATPase
MFDRSRGSEEKERRQAQDAVERTRAELEAERRRLEQERERLERLREELEERQGKLEDRQDELDDREDQIEDLEEELEDLEELESPEEVREVLDIVSARIPGIMKDVQSALYSVESLEKMGEAIGAFYRKLVDSGVPEEQAAQLTMVQQSRLNEITDGRRLHVVRPPRPHSPKRRWTTQIARDEDRTIIHTTRGPEGEDGE